MIDVTSPVPGDAVESEIAHDLARHAAIVSPVLVVGLGLWRGAPAAVGAAIALAVVAGNFVVAAAALDRGARISPTALASVAVGGYVVRLGVITGIGFAVHAIRWIDFPVFGIVLVTAHLGLLFWELRSVSLSLASPGLKKVKE